MKHIFIDHPYNHLIKVTPELLIQLLQCEVHKKEGWGDTEKIYLTDEIVEIHYKNIAQPEEININDIMEENNRLARLVETLESKLKESSSKELAL